MKVGIIAATGPSGRATVEEALERGHEVVALVRNPDAVTITHEKLKTQKINLENEESLVEVFRGCDAVISCLGAKLSFIFSVTLYSDSIKLIASALRKANVNRFVCMSAWGVKYAEGEPGIITWLMRPVLLRTILADMARMEDYIQAECQDINYTVVRPPGLSNENSSGKEVKTYEGMYVPNARGRMPRRDVGKFMLDCLQTNDWDRKMVAVIV